MLGSLTRKGVTEGLKSVGMSKNTATICGVIAGVIVSIVTLDAMSVAADAASIISYGDTSALEVMYYGSPDSQINMVD